MPAAKVKAQAAKEQGNTAFKSGDFPSAVGHYTSAILADPNDSTFPLNRAAAYLKLGKNEDAERDCSTVLHLSKTNVKALFRRAQARSGLEKYKEAVADLKEALRLEPANDSVKQELKKTESLLQAQTSRSRDRKVPAETGSPSKQPSTSAPAPKSSVPPKRRRIPITIVESPPQTDSKVTTFNLSPGSDILKPISSRTLPSGGPQDATSSSSTSPPPLAPQISAQKPSSFKEARQVRESAKPSRVGVGGGIFRPGGKHTIVELKPFPSSGADSTFKPLSKSDTAGPQPTSASAAHPKAATSQNTTGVMQNGNAAAKPPMTLFTFTKKWETLRSPAERWSFFSSVPPTSLPSLFQTSLEPGLLAALLETFLATLSSSQPDTQARVKEYMENLAKVPRFGTVMLFMSKDERMLVKKIWDALGEVDVDGKWRTRTV